MKIRKINFPIGLLFTTGLVLLAIFGLGSNVKGVQDIRFGIDIKGGVEATFQPADDSINPTAKELESARVIIEQRLDNMNILDREVTIDEKAGNIIVRIPWKSDEKDFNPEDTIADIGEMAVLTFQDSSGNILVEGKNVKSSDVAQENGKYVVALVFDTTGTKAFADATTNLVGQQIGIYMDDTLISNPNVNEPITGGTATITGIGGIEEARALAEKIEAGSLPFSMETSNYRTISPALGAKALDVMVMAGIIAFILICLFMIIYYRLPGCIACFALVCQVAIQLLVISVPQMTLTLPGIAGIILTLGMSVDANIIISERISEEIRRGTSFVAAVKKGYENSFSALFDGNLTTAIVATILMIFGSGTMLSFGYTLLTGVIINFFAGIFISKLLLQSILLFKPFKKEKLFRRQKEKNTIPFYKNKKFAFLFSGLVLVGGIAFVAIKGVDLDTQFVGGAIITYSYDGKSDDETVSKLSGKVSDAAEKEVNRTASVQITKDSVSGEQKMVVTLAGKESITPEQQKALNAAMIKTVGKNTTLEESYIVEPYIGKTALKDSAIAIVLAIIFIIIYVGIRFAILSGISAGITSVIALVHDISIVFFTFAVFGIPINDAFVAVVLTIIGYSINDTIVLYDRIRENMSGDLRGQDVGDVVSVSITQVLGRSINTSVATVMCVFIIYVFAKIYDINSIQVFALPMLFGLVSGCYSTIFIASPLWAVWKKRIVKKNTDSKTQTKKNK